MAKSYSVDMAKGIIVTWQITMKKSGIAKTVLNFFTMAKSLEIYHGKIMWHGKSSSGDIKQT